MKMRDDRIMSSFMGSCTVAFHTMVYFDGVESCSSLLKTVSMLMTSYLMLMNVSMFMTFFRC